MPLSTRLPVVDSSTPNLHSPLDGRPLPSGRWFVLAVLATLYVLALATFALQGPDVDGRDLFLTFVFVVDAIGLTFMAARIVEDRRRG